jgi:hypothetical protein
MTKEKALQTIKTLIEYIKSQDTKETKPGTYPLFFKSIGNEGIVKFTDITIGKVVFDLKEIHLPNYLSSNWIKHTETDVWEPVAYNAERKLFDGQPVYSGNRRQGTKHDIVFYDAINDSFFTVVGKRNEVPCSNYKAVKPRQHNKWIKSAYKLLTL